MFPNRSAPECDSNSKGTTFQQAIAAAQAKAAVDAV